MLKFRYIVSLQLGLSVSGLQIQPKKGGISHSLSTARLNGVPADASHSQSFVGGYNNLSIQLQLTVCFHGFCSQVACVKYRRVTN